PRPRPPAGPPAGPLGEKLFRLDKAVSIDILRRRSAAVLRELPAHETHVRSALAAPLRREGAGIGSLALYDKIAPDQFFAEVFTDEDLGVFTRYVSYVERAVANALFYEQARRHRSFDEETAPSRAPPPTWTAPWRTRSSTSRPAATGASTRRPGSRARSTWGAASTRS